MSTKMPQAAPEGPKPDASPAPPPKPEPLEPSSGFNWEAAYHQLLAEMAETKNRDLPSERSVTQEHLDPNKRRIKVSHSKTVSGHDVGSVTFSASIQIDLDEDDSPVEWINYYLAALHKHIEEGPESQPEA